MSGDEFEPTDAEVAAEAARAPLISLNADRWDHFLEWVHDIEVPWSSDTDEYRKMRALSYANGARLCSRDLLQLKPTMLWFAPTTSGYPDIWTNPDKSPQNL